MTARKGYGWKVANVFTVVLAVMVLALLPFGFKSVAALMMVAYSVIWFLRMCMDCLANDGEVDGMRFGEELSATRSAVRAMNAGDRMLLACSGVAWIIAFSAISAVSISGWGLVRLAVVYAISAIILIISIIEFLMVTQRNHRVFMKKKPVKGWGGSDVRSALSVIGEHTVDEGNAE